jgi:N-acetylmuramate 1-kinase
VIRDPAPFLAAHGWQDAVITPFPADWSARRYARLRRAAPPERAILMQTTPDADFHDFIRIDAILRGLGASAPELYAIDAEQGFLLLEDFGDRNFGRLIDQGADPAPLLRRAVAALVEVQRRYAANPGAVATLRRYDTAAFIALLQPLLENFAYPNVVAATTALHETWTALLTPLETQPRSLLLRDFMADNLMDLPERSGWQSVGLLDFELAGIGPVAYDLASLLEHVRRPCADALRTSIIADYLTMRPEIDAVPFRAALAIMAAHRHLRIFARLQKMAKPDFLLNTHAHLRTLLGTPVLRPAQQWCATYLPQHFA